MLRRLLDMLAGLMRAILDLFRVRRADWVLEEIADLPANSKEAELLDGGAGLTNDRMAVWTERGTAQAPNGSVDVRLIRRAVPAAGGSGFTVTRLVMHQQNGQPVHLGIGGVNHGRVIAGTARSRDGLSVWAVLPPGTWLNPQAGGTHHAAADIDETGRIVGSGQFTGGVGLDIACAWATAQAAAPQALFPITPGDASFVAATSPTTRALAGTWRPVESGGPPQPWYQARDDIIHRSYVDGLEGGGQASDINDALTSCGWGRRFADEAASAAQAWRWSPAGGTNWLSGLPGEGGTEQPARAEALNARGEAVGRSGSRAVFWGTLASGGRTRAIDLTAAIGQADLQLSAAVAINDNTEILCFGARTAGGVRQPKVFLVRYTGLRVVTP